MLRYGFVCVIGIFVVFAAPRFNNSRTSTYNNQVKATGAKLEAAIQATHQKWLMQGGGYSVTMPDGQNIAMSDQGWPGSSANSDADCIEIWDDLLQIHAEVRPWDSFLGKDGPGYLAYGAGPMCLYLHTGQVSKSIYRYFTINSETGEFETFFLS